jgi:N-acetylmuramoyl-L-alanine amidase
MGLVQVQPVEGMEGLLNARAAPATTPPAATATQAPEIKRDFIPFPEQRKREMAAYAKRHYGIDTWELREPKVIVEHWTDTDTYGQTHNAFVSDDPDPELHERPAVVAHFVVDVDGTIYQQIPLEYMGRHTVGLNDTAFGIEMVGHSAKEIEGRPPQLQAALALTRWLQAKYGISTANVIGHNESLTSPYHHERVARLRNQTHDDWPKADMDRFRAQLAAAPSGSSAVQPAGCSAALAGSGDAASVIDAADQLDAMNVPYVFGGGHMTPAQPNPGLDCSSSVSWVLQHAGIKVQTMTSTGYMSWGEPGPGAAVTIWANSEHVFMQIGSRYFGTSGFGHPSKGTGPHWFEKPPSAGYIATFTARHPPGL